MSDTVADRRLHPASMIVSWLRELPQTVIGIPAALAFIGNVGIATALLAAAFFAAVLLFFSWLRWSRFRFGLGDDELVIESGLLARSRRTIPFTRIQDVDIERSITHRLLGLARVRVETGGAGSDEGKLDALSLADANALRVAIRAQGSAAQVAEAAVDAAPSPTLIAMSVGDVIRMGLFSYSFRTLAIILGSLGYFANQILDDWWDSDRIAAATRDFAPPVFDWRWLLLIPVVLIVLALVTSIGNALIREYGFRLTREPRGFRRQRGLFTKSDVLIARKRIQLAMLRAGPVWRQLGRVALSVQTLGGGDKTAAAGAQVLAPFATGAQASAVLADVPPLDAPLPSFTPVSRWHVGRAILWSLVRPGVPLIVIAVLYPAFSFVLMFGLLYAGFSAFTARRHGFALEGPNLFVVRGWWRRCIWVMPLANGQSISLHRGLLQRRLGLASLLVDTPGAPAMTGARIRDLPLAEASALLAACRPLIARGW